jgi:hypothetical protein
VLRHPRPERITTVPDELKASPNGGVDLARQPNFETFRRPDRISSNGSGSKEPDHEEGAAMSIVEETIGKLEIAERKTAEDVQKLREKIDELEAMRNNKASELERIRAALKGLGAGDAKKTTVRKTIAKKTTRRKTTKRPKGDGELACRYNCGETFPTGQGRGQHERRNHGGAFKGKAA